MVDFKKAADKLKSAAKHIKNQKSAIALTAIGALSALSGNATAAENIDADNLITVNQSNFQNYKFIFNVKKQDMSKAEKTLGMVKDVLFDLSNNVPWVNEMLNKYDMHFALGYINGAGMYSVSVPKQITITFDYANMWSDPEYGIIALKKTIIHELIHKAQFEIINLQSIGDNFSEKQQMFALMFIELEAEFKARAIANKQPVYDVYNNSYRPEIDFARQYIRKYNQINDSLFSEYYGDINIDSAIAKNNANGINDAEFKEILWKLSKTGPVQYNGYSKKTFNDILALIDKQFTTKIKQNMIARHDWKKTMDKVVGMQQAGKLESLFKNYSRIIADSEKKLDKLGNVINKVR